MTGEQKNNPLHGITLEMMLQDLVARYGWERLGELITIRCFQQNPSIPSSLKFLRKTPWARAKVEALYLKSRPKEKKVKTRDKPIDMADDMAMGKPTSSPTSNPGSEEA